ncbi:hypothetical protein HYV49_06025 [Candidatus Pacearchaeota archaeon]|nr:hypothetical protein [Candidatus Pacearchaeota archaeon]
MLIQILAIIGFILSVYSFYTEKRIRLNNSRNPLCDISESISCSKAFSSRYSHLFLLPNSFYGIIFYFAVFFLSFQYIQIIQLLSIFALAFSVVLAYFSTFKLKTYCVVCNATYITNIILLIAVFY